MKKIVAKHLYIWTIATLITALIVATVPASIDLYRAIIGEPPPPNDGGTPDGNEQEEEEETAERFGFIGDLHFLSEEEIGDDDYASFQSYRYTGERIIPLSEAILKTAVDRYIEQRVTAVFVCGDLTETGSKKSLQKVADELQRLKNAGIKVYVCNGTADIKKFDMTDMIEKSERYSLFLTRYGYVEKVYTPYRFTSTGTEALEGANEDDFRQIFSDFGYNNAVLTDKNSLSYACDVTDNLRLINFSLPYYVLRAPGFPHRNCGNPEVTEESLVWLENALKQAQTDGKEVILMSYFPLFNDMYKDIGDVTNFFAVRLQDCELVQDLCTQYGVRFVISGNAHMASEKTFYDLDGNPVCTNITCPSLTNYPLPIYTVRHGKRWSYSYESLQKIDKKYLPSYYSEEEKEKISSHPVKYASDYLAKEMRKKINLYFNNVTQTSCENAYFIRILDTLCLQSVSNEWAKELRAKADEILDMPLYGVNSMETRLKKYGVKIPKSDYESFFDLFVDCFKQIYTGTYDPQNTLRKDLFRCIAYTILDEAADFGIFERIATVQEDIEPYDTHKITEKVIETGYVNFAWDDLILRIIYIVDDYIYANTDKIDLSGVTSSTVLTVCDLALGLAMNIAYPWAYEEGEGYGSLFGVSFSRYLNTDNHTLNVKAMSEELFFDLCIRDMLY